jgi:acetyl esterase/lipase
MVIQQSAGAHLSLQVALHLLSTAPTHHLTGLLLHFGCYDLSLMPGARLYTPELVLNNAMMSRFISAFVPGATAEFLTSAAVSPFYVDLEPYRGRLPSALFTCGTDDPLLDDSVNMGTRWMMFGGEAVVKIYPGCPHGFIAFEALGEARKALADTQTYIVERMAGI